MGPIDDDAMGRLSGNPYAESAAGIDAGLPGGALRDALLAVAFELRTANLIAIAEGGRAWEIVHNRLGID